MKQEVRPGMKPTGGWEGGGVACVCVGGGGGEKGVIVSGGGEGKKGVCLGGGV